MERDIGLVANEKVIGKPARLLYLGYGRYYAVYEFDEQAIGIDLLHKCATPLSELKSFMATPEQYKEYVTTYRQLEGTNSDPVVLDVPLRNMYDHVLSEGTRGNNNCGPTSGSMIAEYYKLERGFPAFLCGDQ